MLDDSAPGRDQPAGEMSCLEALKAFGQAAEECERSRRTMADALFTRDERPARRAHDAALTNLKQLIGA